MHAASRLTLDAHQQRSGELSRHTISDVLKALTALGEQENILHTPLALVFRGDYESITRYLQQIVDKNGHLIFTLAEYISDMSEKSDLPQSPEQRLRTASVNQELMLGFVAMLDQSRTTLGKLMRFLMYMMGNSSQEGWENTSVENVAIMNAVLTENMTQAALCSALRKNLNCEVIVPDVDDPQEMQLWADAGITFVAITNGGRVLFFTKSNTYQAQSELADIAVSKFQINAASILPDITALETVARSIITMADTSEKDSVLAQAAIKLTEQIAQGRLSRNMVTATVPIHLAVQSATGEMTTRAKEQLASEIESV